MKIEVSDRVKQARANAHLIAAAPELLEALERICHMDEYLEANADSGLSQSQLEGDARLAGLAAIAKAKGEA